MPKWIDLNEMDDDDILLKRNRMSRSLVSDEIPAVKADAYEDDFLDAMEPAKKSMTIFFLIDVSGSMKGTKIGSLNGTMEELLPSLIGVGEASTDVKIAIMKFSTDVEWMTPEPVRIEEYQYWNRLEAEGLTFMGDAFLELSKKLSRSSFLNSPSISFAPVIFLLSDGSPNDDWKKGLETLKQNKWFRSEDRAGHRFQGQYGCASCIYRQRRAGSAGKECGSAPGAHQASGGDILTDWKPQPCAGG